MLENCMISGFADEIHVDLEKQISLLSDLKQTYLEFRSANGKGVAEYSVEEAIELRKRLDHAGIKVSAIGSPIGKILITDAFEPHFLRFQHIVNLAKVLDTRYIRMFSFFIPQDDNPAKYKTEVFHRIGKFIEYAKENNVILLHENEKDIYGDTKERCLELMNEFYGAHFRCTFDFANFIQCKENTLQAYEMLKPFIEYIHIKDALYDTGEVVPAGHGNGHIKGILQDLHNNEFVGYLSLEPHLTNFSGLKDLERDTKTRSMTDGEAAYVLAYDELQKVLRTDSI